MEYDAYMLFESGVILYSDKNLSRLSLYTALFEKDEFALRVYTMSFVRPLIKILLTATPISDILFSKGIKIF